MTLLVDQPYDCPYCGEPNLVRVDTSVEEQDFIEDCTVCCRPIEILVTASPGMVESLKVTAG